MRLILWRFLVWLWAREAQRRYGGPGEQGELFNTSSFQNAVWSTTGSLVSAGHATNWLREHGYHEGQGGCHWYKN